MDKESDSRNDVEGKTMAKWIDYNEDEQRALIANAASAKNIDPVAVEKDWWVTAVLYAVFHSSLKDYALFKGGTSLSKARISSLVSTRTNCPECLWRWGLIW